MSSVTSGTLTERCIEMNKRIKQLVKQAKDHADYYAMLSDGMEQEIFTEKFAELIVRECANVAGRDVGHFVLKHFGVKE